MVLKESFFGAARRRTLICCRNVQISASSITRDRSRSTTVQPISLQRSLIPQQDCLILGQPPAYDGFATGTGKELWISMRCASLNVGPPNSRRRLTMRCGGRRTHLRSEEFRSRLAARPAPTAAHQTDRRWLISDLVTFGCPLTHAEFLIAADRADLETRKAARELPQSPPYREFVDPNVLQRAQATAGMPIANPPDQTRLMSYPVVNANDTWMLHHAAPFAPVRWTNVYNYSAILVSLRGRDWRPGQVQSSGRP